MNSWDSFRKLTSARVGLGRVGSSLPTQRVLEFQRAHAAARSAVWLPWNYQDLAQTLRSQGEEIQILKTQVQDRETYLRFPERGRLLSEESEKELLEEKMKSSLEFPTSIVVTDGLSALALQHHFLPLWNEFLGLFKLEFSEINYKICLVPFGRVAVLDYVGVILQSRLSILFVGERPGLKSPDSLGIYMSFNPQRFHTDAERNCISNIRPPEGLGYKVAAMTLIYLMKESLRLQLSGVHLKNEFEVPENLLNRY